MIAKIAHAHTVAQCGIGTFRPLLLDFILGKDVRRLHLVGGQMEVPKPTPGEFGRIRIYDHVAASGVNYVMADVHLFRSSGAPVYTVVVGETNGEIVPG